MHNWIVSSSVESASKAAADFMAEKIEQCIAQKNICHVALPGGNTPGKCLNFLAEKKLPWKQIHWYVGDERCFPKGHAERNDTMLEKELWSKLPASHSHSIPAELGAEKAAAAYCKKVQDIDAFDIVFLGVGEDGHTASLFPGNPALKDKRSVVPVFNSPKPPSDRVSFSLNTLGKAKCRLILAVGKSKSSILSKIKQGEEFPVNRIGDIDWFVDQAAIDSY